MSLFDNHFASKNAASARAWAVDGAKDSEKKEKHRENAPKIAICDKCHRESQVRSFRVRQTDLGNGAASFGTVVKYFCNDCAPKSRRDRDADVPSLDKKQVKNLMRSAKKGLL